MTDMTPERDMTEEQAKGLLHFDRHGRPYINRLSRVGTAMVVLIDALDNERKAHAETIDKRLDLSIKYNRLAVVFNKEKQRAETAEVDLSEMGEALRRVGDRGDAAKAEIERLKARVDELEEHKRDCERWS